MSEKTPNKSTVCSYLINEEVYWEIIELLSLTQRITYSVGINFCILWDLSYHM